MLTDLFVIFLLRLDYLWSLYLLPWGLSFPIHQSQSDMELAAFAGCLNLLDFFISI
jgi:hypothetical protein